MEISGLNKGLDFQLHVGGPTDLELALYAYLDEEGIPHVTEWNVPGTRYRVDAYNPKSKIAYEADGPWHDKERDTKRDRRIVATGHVVRVIRFGYRELRTYL